MRAQGDYGSGIRGSKTSGVPSEWMTVAEMRECMHVGRTKAYELSSSDSFSPPAYFGAQLTCGE